MAIAYILYNPLSGNGKCLDDVKDLEVYIHDDVEFVDITRITNYSVFLRGMEKDDYLIIAGGDGTLNRFANDADGIEIPQDILYFPQVPVMILPVIWERSHIQIPFPSTDT